MTETLLESLRLKFDSREGPAGPQGVYPSASWDIDEAPYQDRSVVSHNDNIWLALRETSIEPSAEAVADWALWLDGGSAVKYVAQSLSAPQQAQARTNIGAQAASAILTEVAGLTLAAGSMIYATAAEAVAVAPSTAFGRSALNLADALAGRTLLGLGALSTLGVGSGLSSNGTDLSAAVLSVAGRTGAVVLSNSDIAGLGTAALLDAGAASGVATLDVSGKVPLTQIPASMLGGANYQGTWDASTDTPTIPAAASISLFVRECGLLATAPG